MTAPGQSCAASQQCAGYSTGASCAQSLCICLKGSFSNGVACVAPPRATLIIRIARAGCDQYGRPCRTVLSSMRRHPLHLADAAAAAATTNDGAAHKNETTKPLPCESAMSKRDFESSALCVFLCVQQNIFLVWFTLKGERRCPRALPSSAIANDTTDATCLPSETCVDGICKE